jgi:rare lipoprotein A
MKTETLFRSPEQTSSAPAFWAAFTGRALLVSSLALGLANCASKPGQGVRKSSEIGAFSDPKYGKASPRVVAEDESAPKGGGRYQVGQPYTIAGKRYVPREKPAGYTATGSASWYGIAFHGRKTANGEIYDRNSISAAHPTMPLPSYARVTNLANNHSIVVRVNDRGPYHGNRVMDVSERTAALLNFKHMGTARVKIDYLGQAGLAGSDDTKLMASLRTNGPAPMPGNTQPTMVAMVEPVASARPPAQQSQISAFSSQPQANAPLSQMVQDSSVITQTRFVPAPGMPQPPVRPFDLETIGGASQPVTVGTAPAMRANGKQANVSFSLPPARPTELIFTDMNGLLSRFEHAENKPVQEGFRQDIALLAPTR